MVGFKIKFFRLNNDPLGYVQKQMSSAEAPSPPLVRKFSRGTNWVCGCGRHHKVPNETRDNFKCPVCSEVYPGPR